MNNDTIKWYEILPTILKKGGGEINKKIDNNPCSLQSEIFYKIQISLFL